MTSHRGPSWLEFMEENITPTTNPRCYIIFEMNYSIYTSAKIQVVILKTWNQLENI